jgi:FkbM family methyltransferase
VSAIRTRIPGVRRLWGRKEAEWPELPGMRLVRALAEARPNAVFVEIGANDGAQYDPLRKYILRDGWRGVMVEPVPYVFERLRRNYGHLDRVALENVAIADADGEVPFYYLAQASDAEEEGLPSWYDAIGSLSRGHVAAPRDEITDIESRVESIRVPALTFESLCQKHGLGRLDLLLIDTEGYDYEIIRRIDFAAHRPRLLIYEHSHLGDELEGCRAYVEGLGYETMQEYSDTFCVDTQIDDRLTRLWRRRSPKWPGTRQHDAK